MEYRHHWFAAFATFIFGIFVGAGTGFLLAESERVVFEVNSISSNRFVLDFIFVGMAPSFATIFFAKPYLSYFEAKEDPYGKRMAFLRSLPIPISVLALSRMLLVISNVAVMSVAFYGAMTIVIYDYFELMTAGEMMTFILLWIGFMLALGGVNPYIEYGTNGKFLHIFPFLYMAIFIIFETFYFLNFKQGIVETSIQLVESIGWPLAVISIVIGAACCYGWNLLLKNRLQTRDYL